MGLEPRGHIQPVEGSESHIDTLQTVVQIAHFSVGIEKLTPQIEMAGVSLFAAYSARLNGNYMRPMWGSNQRP